MKECQSSAGAAEGGRDITVDDFFRDNSRSLKLRWLAGKAGGGRRIQESSIHRLGLSLTGFFDYFADKRIQIFGGAENAYLKSLSPRSRLKSIGKLLEQSFPCIIFSRNIRPDPRLSEICEEKSVPLLVSPKVTYSLVNGIILYLEKAFAPSINLPGNLVDVHGTGVLIRGPSGIGKSECVLALIRRGAALVADDVVRITRKSQTEVVGTVPVDEMMGYMEIRGLGLINIIQMFGISSFHRAQQIDLVVTLNYWDSMDRIDRTGLDSEKCRIFEVDLPHITIPVAPGRETANVIEVAAQEFRMRKLGIHSAVSLNNAIIRKIAGGKKPSPRKKTDSNG